MFRRLLFTSALFALLGSGSGCCLLHNLIHCETYDGPSCGPKYWGPYCVSGCDPCDSCGNFVKPGYPNTPSRCGLSAYGALGHGGGYISEGFVDGGGHYDGEVLDGQVYDGAIVDGEVIYDGPASGAPAHAVYEQPVHPSVSHVSHHGVPPRKVPHAWRMP